MIHFHNPEDIFRHLIQWAEQRTEIRAMLLTSTRAVPDAPLDELSDYDVVLIVKDIHQFYQDREWLKDFGEVLVVYWDPIHSDPDYGLEKSANVTQYADGLKMDFTLLPVEWLQRIVQTRTLPAELDAGYIVLLDKDHLGGGMPSPGYRAYIPVRPTDELYQITINDFFSDPPYAAKCLLRGELLPLKWCLDYDMKHVYLRQMLEWRMEIGHDWSVPSGALGKGLKKRLPAEIWSQLEGTYASADTEANWQALFRTMALFREVAVEVGKNLGYSYPLDLDRRVTEYVWSMHGLAEAGTQNP